MQQQHEGDLLRQTQQLQQQATEASLECTALQSLVLDLKSENVRISKCFSESLSKLDSSELQIVEYQSACKGLQSNLFDSNAELRLKESQLYSLQLENQHSQKSNSELAIESGQRQADNMQLRSEMQHIRETYKEISHEF
jgi:hypothetical protein